jgi:metal-responsive CopG/Arc/MetJ family transcriptional regulator
MLGPKIEMDKALFAKIKEHAEAQGYSSPEEFVKHLIERELGQSANAEEDPAKLKGIGYMDFGRDI